MTMLAFNVSLPLQEVTDWRALFLRILPALQPFVASFVVAASFWIAHHRRLEAGGVPRLRVVLGNMVFLLAVVLLPIATRAYARLPGPAGSGIYAADLLLIALTDLALWAEVLQRTGHGIGRASASGLAVPICLAVGVDALWRPGSVLSLALVALLVTAAGQVLESRFGDPGLRRHVGRQFASLSDNVFGVALTLLAYDIRLPDRSAGNTAGVAAILLPQLEPLVLGFAVGAMLWLGHQRRLAAGGEDAPPPGRLASAGNMTFLFCVVLLPIATRLFRIDAGLPVYGLDLLLLALLHLLLWREARQRTGEVARAPLVLLLIVALGETVAFAAPHLAVAIWLIGFLSPLSERNWRHAAAGQVAGRIGL